MKVVEYDRYGDPSVLVVRERPDPVARPGRVVVRVRAAALTGTGLRSGETTETLRNPGRGSPTELDSRDAGLSCWRGRLSRGGAMRSIVAFASLVLLGVALLVPWAEAVPNCKEGECQDCKINGVKGRQCCEQGRLSACAPLCGDELCEGGTVCVNRACVCPNRLTDCGGTCQNLVSDPKNCGECNNVCKGGRTCQRSACACQSGFTDCEGTCRNLATDANNCGECSHVCPIGTSCQPPSLSLKTAPGVPTPKLKPGVCTCVPPTVQCGDACRNLTNDPSNCGTCGKICAPPTPACRNSQCAAPPGPTSFPTAGSTGDKVLDLFWSATDPNRLPLNPDWRARSNPALIEGESHPHVIPLKACPACDHPDRGVCQKECVPTHIGLDGSPEPGGACLPCMEKCWQRCTTQPLSYDDGLFCEGHKNWIPATYTGTLVFDDYEARGFLGGVKDDDYNFNLTTDGDVGLIAKNRLHGEMAFFETIDRFQSPFWKKFEKLVNDIPSDDLTAPRALFNGENGTDAILIGLVDIDFQHGPHAELHPIYAMAFRTNDPPTAFGDPNHDCWAMFARNWGNQGFCSQHPDAHNLGLTDITFFLPQPRATAVTEISRRFNASTATSLSEVAFVPGGALITFHLRQPDDKSQINGELCLRWAVAPAATRPFPRVAAAIDAEVREPDEDLHPGIELLTPAQLAQLKAALPARKPRDRKLDLFEPKRVPFVARPAIATAKLLVHGREGQPDVQKQARDELIHRKMCEMLRNHPKRPKICDHP